ncbi:MAG: hypothetical protein COT81_01845 [Candidatus Buchananbacteria bacterium CG10_big_fil_rev_8_21_14_0_10_42_9]|uniref:Bacterial sugar transferase domain-containing protein n=1 Tax=Candidatus Buchananbacteria bacterium CG10_big_fil_rev_8_21_14_0_10_42_9 TaxID=1974526 RepID=A0A2H0W1P5_9BACT|nr:MAG: hypothetical protein COT81_01845 [Candidatus Buchananbacteria bacterium CG10_big_fil_rev_8_21_14_0_10_42_9]
MVKSVYSNEFAPRLSLGNKFMGLNVRKFILIIGDIILLYVSLYLALTARYFVTPTSDAWLRHVWPFTIVFAIWFLVLFIDEWYDLRKYQQQSKFYYTLTRDMVINALIATAIFYFFAYRFTNIRPQTILVIDVVIFSLLFTLWRQFIIRITRNKLVLRKAIIIGKNEETETVKNELNSKSHLGYKIIDLLAVETFDFKTLKNYIRQNNIDTIIMANDARENPAIIEEVFKCLDQKLAIHNLDTFYENISSKILINTIGQLWFLENLNEQSKQAFDLIKRLLDIILAALLGSITLILLPFIALAIKADSPGPIFYKQKRLGKNQKEFEILKFRSMVANAEANGAVWSAKDDKRITRLGKFMRKTRIDELPQLINILRGEMSFIGPRPERPEFYQELSSKVPFYNERHLVKPGLTGWAQVNLAYDASTEYTGEKLQYDLYYIKNRSIFLDLAILLRTIKTIISRGGR